MISGKGGPRPGGIREESISAKRSVQPGTNLESGFRKSNRGRMGLEGPTDPDKTQAIVSN